MFAVQMVKPSGINLLFGAEEGSMSVYFNVMFFIQNALTFVTGKGIHLSHISICVCLYMLMGDLLVVRVWKDMPQRKVACC